MRALIATLVVCAVSFAVLRVQGQENAAGDKYVTKDDYQKLKVQHEKLQREMDTLKTQLDEMLRRKAVATPTPQDVQASKAQQSETDQAIDALEKELKTVKQMAKDSFPGTTKMLLTGYGSGTYTSTSKGYGPAQPLPPDDRTGRSFFTATFNPIFLWKLSDRLLFEGELELELENSDTTLSLEMANMSYILNDYMTISGGKFLNPMDYFVERQHMAWVNKMPDKPLAVYDGLIPDESLLGAQLRGAVPVGSTKFGYAFFVANAPTLVTNADVSAGTLAGDNFENFGNHTAVGGRVGFYPIPELEIGYGAEYASVRPSGLSTSDINTLLQSVDGTYVRDSERLKGIINLHAQWVWSHVDRFNFDTVDPTAGLGAFSNNRNGGYVQLAYRPSRVQNRILANLEPVVRYDMINQRKTPVGFDESRWSVGLDFWINPSTVVKVAYEFDHQRGPEGHNGNALLVQAAVGF